MTPLYSPPERCNTCDQRKVDVWAAGCILYELCTGHHFIQARSERDRFIARAALQDPAWQPPQLPRPMACWQPLLDGMLAQDPASRLLPAELLGFDIFACALAPCVDAMSAWAMFRLLWWRSLSERATHVCLKQSICSLQ